MSDSIIIIAMLVISGIIVGIINTLAGGGAIISMTLFMVLGLPISVANGTNRIAVVLQNFTASLAFLRKRMLDIKSGVKLSIPAGIDNGQIISLRGQGHAGKNGGPAGDLQIVVNVRPHELFRRDGSDVFCDAPITFTQAVLGGEMEIPTIDGKVKYDIPEGTQTGSTFRLRNKGIPNVNGRGRGDQYVTVYIETPRNLNKEQKERERASSRSSKNNRRIRRGERI